VLQRQLAERGRADPGDAQVIDQNVFDREGVLSLIDGAAVPFLR
jgi:hypothetical protein